jgi:ketosteroid isomerase-like protein
VAELARLLGERTVVTSIELRLAGLAARDQIAELPHRYAIAYAELDLDALVALYRPDVELLNGDTGRAALRAHFEQGIRTGPGGGLDTVVLHTGNHVIQVTGADGAVGTVYCHVEVILRDGTGYYQAVRYTDSYCRRGDRWYFARQRTHELCYGAPFASRPNGRPDADWPARQIGRGTVPYRLPTWQEFGNAGG